MTVRDTLAGMRALCLITLVALVACSSATWTRGDRYTTVVRTPSTATAGTWSAAVAEGERLWWPAFKLPCQFPFVATPAGVKTVTLIPAEVWDEPTSDDGYTTKISIHIRGDSVTDKRALVAHELGHAMGLQHTGRLTSIMYPVIAPTKVPDAQDLKDAAAAMGCP